MLDLALDGRIFLDNPLDCALQEIDMLLNTENTQLIGYPNYGTEFETFLWTLSPTTLEIEKYIREKIEQSTHFASQYKIFVKASYMEGEYRSIYYVRILLMDDEGNTGVREYQYQ
ncbi:MAG: hypothetical protein IJH39_12715 [Clostridia bacterium]|nr:hypothetical protein [Clostridia bacterium]